MSLVVAVEEGWLLDHQRGIKQCYADVHDELGQNCGSFQFNPDLFEIRSAFLMDSQVRKGENRCGNDSEPSSEDVGQQSYQQRKRKRKRKHTLNEGEKLGMELHEKVRVKLLSSFQKIQEVSKATKFFVESCDLEKGDNNRVARLAADTVGPGDSLVELCQMGREMELPAESQRVYSFSNGAKNFQLQPLNKLHHFKGDNPQIVKLLGDRYVIPARCSFLLSDISRLGNFSDDLGKFDLIVMDPPWENKSVKRKKKYSSLAAADLLQLPIQALTVEGGLVAVWVTNRHKHIRYVQDRLFPAWSVTYLGRWFWIKVTWSGEMVYDFDSPHKKPYETLILGQRTRSRRKNEEAAHTSESLPSPYRLGGIRDGQVIVSVPCSLHSKKPPLLEVLQNYLPSQPRCLELFARNLLPGWTSWGNEVLLHQHMDFFKPVT